MPIPKTRSELTDLVESTYSKLRAELDAAQAADQSARAAVRASNQRLEMAQRQLAYTRLTAPYAGAVAAVQVEVNADHPLADGSQCLEPVGAHLGVDHVDAAVDQVGDDLGEFKVMEIRSGSVVLKWRNELFELSL